MLIDDFKTFSIAFTTDTVLKLGSSVITKIGDTLWYMGCHHYKPRDRHLPIPKVFRKYQGLNKYLRNHKAKSTFDADLLYTHFGTLASILAMP